MTDTHPDVAPYNVQEADDCADPECPRKAHTHIVVVHNGVDHRVPFCVDHHLKYSQPGHLKILKKLAGISHLFHEDEEQQNPAAADPDQHVEPPYTPIHAEPGKDLKPMEAVDAGALPEPQETTPPGPLAGQDPAPVGSATEKESEPEVIEPASSQVEGEPIAPGDEIIDPSSKDA